MVEYYVWNADIQTVPGIDSLSALQTQHPVSNTLLTIWMPKKYCGASSTDFVIYKATISQNNGMK
jgi:hypothetical protein